MTVTGVVEKRVPIPEGVEVVIEGGTVTVQKGDIRLSRSLTHPRVQLRRKGAEVLVESVLPRKREKALAGTFASHVGNMVRGVTDGFTYTMRVVYAHFPVKVSVQGDAVVIENFLGERHPRRAPIRGPTQVEVKGDTLLIRGPDLEAVSQTAANVEQVTRIKRKDPRVFQDGIYLVSKGEA
ncbi:MAG: 50S ribosomal protein L6 [Thermoplasmata archaeon]